MTVTGPIVLQGDNLGQRHCYLNSLVNNAFYKKIPFESISELPEKSPVDRFFKIDLASKYCNVDFILKTLKDENILFVNRALKCTWLLHDTYGHIINPDYLETKLYPEMLINASYKMKHWISLNLKSENLCRLFYEYYKTTDNDYALKFLPRTSPDYLLAEMQLIPINKITPHFLKLLCEKSWKAADIFLNHMPNDYVNEKYIKVIQPLLKIKPDFFFHLIENSYYVTFDRLNEKTTRYIMKHHKDRYQGKPELYAGWILHLPTLATFLSEDEVKDIVIKLTRASYLQANFTYKIIEPLLKKINRKERNSFCKNIFEEKSMYSEISLPPYPMRLSSHKQSSSIQKPPEVPKSYDILLDCPEMLVHPKRLRQVGGGGSLLDLLFNQYRFSSFETTLASLKKRICTEGSMGGRQNMILVLVSKSGGRTDALQQLLDLLVPKHLNEPANLRAAVVRSLVKRAAVWRLPPEIWNKFLKFAHGLGLNGDTPEAPCDEGLHAVMLHNLIYNHSPPLTVEKRFLNEFTTLKQYSLTDAEAFKSKEYLTSFLLQNTKDCSSRSVQKTIIMNLMDVIYDYGGHVTDYPEVIECIYNFAKENDDHAETILKRLFKAYEARKMFFEMNFRIIQTDASYLNALRHDANILKGCDNFRQLLSEENLDGLNHGNFFRKLAIYFSEEGGLASTYADVLKEREILEPHSKLNKPIRVLTETFTQECNTTLFGGANYEPVSKRPRIDGAFEAVDLKSLANWIQCCSKTTLLNNMVTLMSEPRWAFLVMALRAVTWPGLIAGTLLVAGKHRPTRALRVALHIIRQNTKSCHPRDWQAIKSFIRNLTLKTHSDKFYIELVQIDCIPEMIKLEFCLTVYRFLVKYELGWLDGPSYRFALPLVSYLNDNCRKLDDECFKSILLKFFTYDFVETKARHNWGVSISHGKYTEIAFRSYFYYYYVEFFLQMFSKFLLTRQFSLDLDVLSLFLGKWEMFRNEPVFNSTPPLVRVRHGLAIASIFDQFLMSFYELRELDCFLKNDFAIQAINMTRKLCANTFPLHENFKGNYIMKLAWLYARTLKAVASDTPQLFESKDFCEESLNEVSFHFGLRVAEDIEQLVSENFQSIKQFYAKTLYEHFRPLHLRKEFFTKGLLCDTTKLNAMYVGLYLQSKWGLKMENGQRLLLSMTKEVKFFLFAQLNDNFFKDI